jgi:hypothetical protein
MRREQLTNQQTQHDTIGSPAAMADEHFGLPSNVSARVRTLGLGMPWR